MIARLSPRRAATALAIVLLSGAGGWLLHERIVQQEHQALRRDAYLQTLLAAHRMYRHPPSGVLLAADQFGRLAAQIERQLGVTVSLPAAEDGRLAYRGGRILPLRGRPAALLIFGRDRRRVSLIVTRAPLEGVLVEEDQAAFHRSVQDPSIALAEQAGLQLGVVGQVSTAQLERLTGIIDHRGGI